MGPASDLALPAAKMAIAQAGLEVSDVDAIIFATLSPDIFFPGSGCLLGHKIGLGGVPALDVRNQCSGFLYSLSIADAWIRGGMYRNILVVGAEVHSTGMLFERGDGVHDALFVGPLRAGEYIAAKGISLTLLALLSSSALALGAGGPELADADARGVALTSSMITFFAVAIGSRLTTVNRYFFGGALLSLPLIAPIFEFVGVVSHPLFAWSPAAPGLSPDLLPLLGRGRRRPLVERRAPAPGRVVVPGLLRRGRGARRTRSARLRPYAQRWVRGLAH